MVSMGWLVLSESDMSWANNLLEELGEDDAEEKTLDELGFGILRDAFADAFFPATSTIMTRARYLVFIPAMCWIVENEKKSGKDAERRRRELENQLRKKLGNVDGVIGRKNAMRYSPGIYWSALRKLGIFLQPFNIHRYQQKLKEFYEETKFAKDDDGNLHKQSSIRNWDDALTSFLDDNQSCLQVSNSDRTASREWASHLGFSLTRCEAEYLQKRYQALISAHGIPSIIWHLLNHTDYDGAQVDYPWDVADLPPHTLNPLVEHARLLSMMAQGATLQYCHLLQREKDRCQQKDPNGESDWPALFEEWWISSKEPLSQWRFDDFMENARKIGGARRPSDFDFIRDWLRLNGIASNPTQMLENGEAHDLIRKREKQVRGSKARIGNRDGIANWEPPKGKLNGKTYALDFRARTGLKVVRDIVDGLRESAHV
jgi:hypothetical protein